MLDISFWRRKYRCHFVQKAGIVIDLGLARNRTMMTGEWLSRHGLSQGLRGDY